jgi:hypothetical protein
MSAGKIISFELVARLACLGDTSTLNNPSVARTKFNEARLQMGFSNLVRFQSHPIFGHCKADIGRYVGYDLPAVLQELVAPSAS